MLRRLALRGFTTLRLQRLMRRFHRDRLVILMYHGFRDDETRGLRNFEGNHVHVDQFARQAEYLAAHHNVVPLETVAGGARAGDLPPHPVVITMDDGYRSNYRLALPILQRLGLPATVFVTTGFVEDHQPLWPDRLEWALDTADAMMCDFDLAGESFALDLRTDAGRRRGMRELLERLKAMPQERLGAVVDAVEERLGRALGRADAMPELYQPLEWDEIRAMAATGLVGIGNHTHRHLILSRLSPERQREEIERAHATIAARAGVTCRTFCYPNGGPDDYDAHTKRLLAEMHYVASPTTAPGWNDAGTDPFELRRVALNDHATFEDFLMILYGGWRRLASDIGAAVRGTRRPASAA